jgi:pyridoxine 4-dehydrogenase
MRITPASTLDRALAKEEACALLRRVVQLGINLIDTAGIYGDGANESLIRTALAPYPRDLIVTTKGGLLRANNGTITIDCRPEHLRAGCHASLKRLGLGTIKLYQMHQVDPMVPIEESVGALLDLKHEGKIRHIGLSNVNLVQLRSAMSVAPIATVQNTYNAISRGDDEVLEFCITNRIAFLAWGPLGGNYLAHGGPLAERDGLLGAIAKTYELSSSQVALAWLLQRAPNIVPIPGTTTAAHLEENFSALTLLG